MGPCGCCRDRRGPRAVFALVAMALAQVEAVFVFGQRVFVVGQRVFAVGRRVFVLHKGVFVTDEA